MKTNESVEMVELYERADKLRYFIFLTKYFYFDLQQTKKRTSYSQFDENDEGTDTVIENKEKLNKEEEEEEKNSVEESLQKVNSILVEI